MSLDFQGVISVVLLVGFALQRLSCTFSPTTKRHEPLRYDQLFTSFMLFLYALIVISASFYYFYNRPTVTPLGFVSGMILLMMGIAIRTYSIAEMGENWCVYLSAKSIKNVVRTGVYSCSRHPYYWASLLELSGVVLLLGCNKLILGIGLLYAPLVCMRSILEERYLCLKFNQEYAEYRKFTPFFFKIFCFNVKGNSGKNE